MPYTQVLISDPLYLQPDTYTAQDDRRHFADLVGAGVVGANDFLVTSVSGLQVSVAAGVAYIPGLNTADQGHYRLYEPSSHTISVGVGDGSNPRIDQIILRVLDAVHDTSTLNETRIEVVPGTPTSGATLANRAGAADLTALTENSKNVLLLADVLVPAGAASIDASKIGDKRVRARVGGGKAAGGSGQDGWSDLLGAWSYGSADGPTFTMTAAGDYTNVLTPRARIKLTNSGIKYFIVTAVSYSAPTTTVTMYGGTDYTLINAAITSPFFSLLGSPIGFPANPIKWTVELADATDRTQTSPGTSWFNVGALFLSIPIGAWDVVFQGTVQGNWPGNQVCEALAALSTSNSSPNDNQMKIRTSGTNTARVAESFHLTRKLLLGVKTSYFPLVGLGTTGGDAVILLGSSGGTTTVRAVCAYL
jgi:hypothetical protein